VMASNVLREGLVEILGRDTVGQSRYRMRSRKRGESNSSWVVDVFLFR